MNDQGGRSHGARKEWHDADGAPTPAALEELMRMEDPEGRPAYVTVYADLTTGAWEEALKRHAEALRAELGDQEAEAIRFHHAFDEAFVEVERVARTKADGVVVIVSPLHHVQMTYTLPGRVETSMVARSKPDLRRLRETLGEDPAGRSS
jgi:hypothetical protein